VILDDILTTGSTVSEIARLLKTYGADEIYVLTVASVKG
ncbi:MAG: ComF family protein, partial [bacterium]|nr:ComF family protein [bacterium]